FLARDGARGWADLCRQVSAAHTADGLPRLAWEDNRPPRDAPSDRGAARFGSARTLSGPPSVVPVEAG
ncbi:hypothetical protein, partial [Kitasatospora sp. NPDC127060]|uniref:hypothetical protein n=1 Tax=Kitasatospora sp. NPDC127060 TaxID=3347121 RepID=UPI003665A554